MQDGQIGEIVTIEENFIRGPYGSINRNPSMRELEQQYANQYRFSWLCGDDVVQSLVHNLDRATWAMKETPPVRCHGLGGRSGPQNLLGDVFDHHSVVYHYANGVRLYAFCRTTNNCYNEDSSIIMGTKGVAHLKTGQITGQKPWRYSGPNVSPYVIEHQELIKSVRAGKPMNCGEYAARSTLVAIMGQLSCYSGQEVTWDEVSRSELLLPAPARGLHLDHGTAHQARRQGRLPGVRRARHDQDRVTTPDAAFPQGRSTMRHALMAACCWRSCCSCPRCGRRRSAAKARVLVLTGNEYPGHHWKETAPLLAKFLADDPRLDDGGAGRPELPRVAPAARLRRRRAQLHELGVARPRPRGPGQSQEVRRGGEGAGARALRLRGVPGLARVQGDRRPRLQPQAAAPRPVRQVHRR